MDNDYSDGKAIPFITYNSLTQSKEINNFLNKTIILITIIKIKRI